MFKPHYAPGEHSLWADVVYTTSPLRQYTGFLLSSGVVMGLKTAQAIAYHDNLEHSYKSFAGFMGKVQKKYNMQAKVHDMFINPGTIH